MTTTIIKSGSIHINGKVYKNIQGSMEITDKGIFINGKPIEEYKEPPVFKIVIEGDVQTIETDSADIEVKGNVNEITSKNGNITCGEVLGNIDCKNGNITCGNVRGDVNSKNGNIMRL